VHFENTARGHVYGGWCILFERSVSYLHKMFMKLTAEEQGAQSWMLSR
jgi:hypothetical protein